MFQKAQAGHLLPDCKSICGTDLPLVILGDHAYPLLLWRMKPFVDHGKTTCLQKTFNYSLSHARIVAEHAFGRLKGRRRCLLKQNGTIIEDLPTVVSACCVFTTYVKCTGITSTGSGYMTWMQSHHCNLLHYRCPSQQPISAVPQL